MGQINLEEAIFYSKLIIKNGDYYSGMSFKKYSKGYLGTIEYIDYYLRMEKFKKGKALTILSSGDHVFNLAFSDVKEIDAFDINILQYFVYKLRKAMIECLSYEEFIYGNASFFNVYLDETREVLEKVKSSLSEDVYEYYRVILEYASKNGRLEKLYNASFCSTIMNAYLENEEAYLSLRRKLKDVNVNLYFGNALDVANSLNGSYDIILLSNISDYLGKKHHPLTLEEFREYIFNFYDLLNDAGIIINYLYNVYAKYIINNSVITRDDLGYNNVMKISGTDNQGYYRIRKVA